jgi:hypothetical protein
VAELTKLEEKLGEVIGLAMAARAATDKVAKLTEDGDLTSVLERMSEEAAEAETRATRVAETIEGKKTAILDKARETKRKAQDMMDTYLEGEDEALDGFEFLTMAEAGEVGHWKVLRQMADAGGRSGVSEIAAWGIPIQERHFSQAQAGALRLAADEDPDETS